MCGLVNWAPRGDPEQKCVKLKYVLSYSPPEQASEGGTEEDANSNAVPGLSANIGSDGQQKALGGHPFFMRCNGSKANILFFSRGEKKTLKNLKWRIIFKDTITAFQTELIYKPQVDHRASS